MTIELLDPDSTLEFIPESEKNKENPTIIHLRHAHVLDSIKRNRLVKVKKGVEGSEVEFAEDEVWFDYILWRIVKIENVSIDGQLTTVAHPDGIKDVVRRLTRDVGSELLDFFLKTITTARLSEDQTKN